jgi:predicted ribosome quality control (RQC) complex YloA/Tae2 family protein
VSSKGRPYRTVIVDGFEILIGRGARENDLLSFRIAQRGDTWLHVGGGSPGSHVVIRNPERQALPPGLLECAAAFAAWYSKARDRGLVEVSYCDAGDVRKRRGAPAGQVELVRFKRLKVVPRAPNDDTE